MEKRTLQPKRLVFDAGPIISLATNNLLEILPLLKDKFRGEFLITPVVRKEVVDKPLLSKRFKFEALQILQQISLDTLMVIDSKKLHQKTLELLGLANTLYRARGNWMRIMHIGEIETLAAAALLHADAIVIDERTTRMVLESPTDLVYHLESKLHTKVTMNEINVVGLQTALMNIPVIRSTELVTIGFELGFFDKYLAQIPEPRKTLIEGLLWGVKLKGCAISDQEIQEIVKAEQL
ncbi:hypothetical protein HYW21_02695 [Candidatus Woesearchaeota archaeon]|nr:hypothetical protein [Candidatus Woesearchaeota archaeon]